MKPGQEQEAILPNFSSVENRSEHTFAWLKVLVITFAIEVIIGLLFALIANAGEILHSLFIPFMAFICSATGAVIGLLLNLLSKFKRVLLFYTIGQVLAIPVLYIMISFFILDPGSPKDTYQPDIRNIQSDTASSIIKGHDKYAIEEVLFLMEQQYPLGAYGLTDIITEYKDLDSASVYCTIVFTLKDEKGKKYISQYLVKNGSVEPVYTKRDTASGEYRAYELKSTAR